METVPMFGKRKTPDESAPGAAEGTGSEAESPLPLKRGRPGQAASSRPAPRRPIDPLPASGRRAEARASAVEASQAAASANEGRKLVVGEEIRLSGEIKKCEKLVVEGQVEANLTDCLSLEIAETGLFNGSAVVEEADISGTFEGELTAKGRLYVRASGRVLGTIRYADLEIERGGRLAGSVDVIEPEPEPEVAVEIVETPVAATHGAAAASASDDSGGAQSSADEREQPQATGDSGSKPNGDGNREGQGPHLRF